MDQANIENENILTELRIMKQNIMTLRGTVRQITSDSAELASKYRLVDRQLSIVHTPFVDAVKKALAPVAQAAHTLISGAEKTLIATKERVAEITLPRKPKQDDQQIDQLSGTKLRRSRRLSSTAPDWDLDETSDGSDDDNNSHKRLKQDDNEVSLNSQEIHDPASSKIPTTVRKLALGSARRILTTAKKPLSAMSRVYTNSKKKTDHKAVIRNLR